MRAATHAESTLVILAAIEPLLAKHYEDHARKEERQALEARLRSTAQHWRKRTYGTPEARHFGRSYADKLEALASEETEGSEYGKHLREVCERHRARPLDEQRIQGRAEVSDDE